MAAEAVDRLCAGLLGNLLGMPSPPAPPPAAAGWPGESPAGWEQAWEATTRSLVGQAGAGFQQGRRVREAAIVLALARQAAAVEPGTLHRIGEDTAERLDIVPAQFRVLVVRRPKYGCRSCQDVVVQASAPPRLIEGGLPTEATIAQVLVAKYSDQGRDDVRAG